MGCDCSWPTAAVQSGAMGAPDAVMCSHPHPRLRGQRRAQPRCRSSAHIARIWRSTLRTAGGIRRPGTIRARQLLGGAASGGRTSGVGSLMRIDDWPSKVPGAWSFDETSG